jgi:hypothetical protein
MANALIVTTTTYLLQTTKRKEAKGEQMIKKILSGYVMSLLVCVMISVIIEVTL